ncbi:contactin-associated protein-like 2 isoform X1 [Montipora capricornis]|uniref:contactin-associated protein-like 2 isoform X1 n=1 Tax=Montipora capricornis TaxID=246305 RepID=UPI0035F1241B
MSHSLEQVQRICSAFGVLTVSVLFALQYFQCSANSDRIIIFKEPIPNMAMGDHVISREEVPNEGSCRVNCYLHPDCVSINMGPLTGGKLTCELNNTTAPKDSTLSSKKGHTYLEIENPCSSSPCLNGGTCQAGFTSKGFRCLCTNSSFAGIQCEIAKSCSHLKQLDPAAESGVYTIHPFVEGNLTPFDVACNMTEKNGVGVTVISHDSESRTSVQGYEEKGRYSRDIHYTGASLSQLANLATVSAHCEQFIRYECYGSVLWFNNDSYGWWVSRDSTKMTYWGGRSPGDTKCTCDQPISCAKLSDVCNCDKNDNVWREDSGLLTDKQKLPVKQLRFGDTGHTGEQGYHTLGKFKCYGTA